jgi:cytoskeletal protein CcmA (bactofilin family)
MLGRQRVQSSAEPSTPRVQSFHREEEQEERETTIVPTAAPAPTFVRESRPAPLLTVLGSAAKLHGKFEIADSIEIECEIGGELTVGGKLVVGKNGIVRADVHTVDAVIVGLYEGNLVATGDVEIAETGRVIGNIETDSLVISKGGFFNGNVIKPSEPSMPRGQRPTPVSLEERRAAFR